MKLLNSGYETETVGGSLYYNSKSGTCYNGSSNSKASCDFTYSGLKNEISKSKMAEATWNLGGWGTSFIYSNQIYKYERGTTVYSGNSTTWKGKIALPYPSDYGYATNFDYCTQELYYYNSSTCTNNNWMYSVLDMRISSSMSYEGWLLTPNSDYEKYVWKLEYSGNVSSTNSTPSANHGVNPTLYLNSEGTMVEGTTGTIDNPYKLNP